MISEISESDGTTSSKNSNSSASSNSGDDDTKEMHEADRDKAVKFEEKVEEELKQEET